MMILLNLFLTLLLILAISIFLFPAFKQRQLKKKILFSMLFIFFIMTAGLYYLFGGFNQLKAYQTKIEADKVKEIFGSIENIEIKLKSQLEKKPDGRGWYLLGKLYLSQNQYQEAVSAFKNAMTLNPDKKEFTFYYQQALTLFENEKTIQAMPGIEIQVDVSDNCKKQLSPETTIFIIIKTPSINMPLAGVKKQVKDLPLAIKFTDQSLLVKNVHLSDFKKMTILARTSLTGDISITPEDHQIKKTLEDWSKVKQPILILIP